MFLFLHICVILFYLTIFFWFSVESCCIWFCIPKQSWHRWCDYQCHQKREGTDILSTFLLPDHSWYILIGSKYLGCEGHWRWWGCREIWNHWRLQSSGILLHQSRYRIHFPQETSHRGKSESGHSKLSPMNIVCSPFSQFFFDWDIIFFKNWQFFV